MAKFNVTGVVIGGTFVGVFEAETAEAAIEKARPTMKAMFCFSNRIPSTMATAPRQIVAILDTRISAASDAVPFMITRA